jgi:hypothetical protein
MTGNGEESDLTAGCVDLACDGPPGCKPAGERRRKVDYRDLPHVFSRRERGGRPAGLPFGTSCLPEVQEAATVKDDRVHWKKRQKEIERLKARHGADRSLVREFPDLKVEQRTAPCSNVIRGGTARRPRPAGMKQFPVGHSHKQGLELITPGMDLQWMGGKKT